MNPKLRRTAIATAKIAAFSNAPATRSPAGSATRKPSGAAATTYAPTAKTAAPRPRAFLGDEISAASTATRSATRDYRRPYTGRFAAVGFGGDDDRPRPDLVVARSRLVGTRGERATSREFTGRSAGRHDPHYGEWRQRQIDSLDRDYDEYRRENQSRFESEFADWRDQRQGKRQLLGQIREHMEVVGIDEEHVGTVDRIAGDRIILTKSDRD